MKNRTKFNTIDEVKWAQIVEANDDSYGAAAVSYAATWASCMDAELAKLGETPDVEVFINAHAERLSHTADTEGITGFMYGWAVHQLANHWVHGEFLRRWHNKAHGKPDVDGTINPAVFTIG